MITVELVLKTKAKVYFQCISMAEIFNEVEKLFPDRKFSWSMNSQNEMMFIEQ